ncbi:MAG TPA: uracil-DNA glycosylase [Elusimicrobiota bacterium]|nr:uracil-DNA glycosylase [Elusimicrobiota bacterium]
MSSSLLERALATVDPSWSALLAETRQPYFRELWRSVEEDYARGDAAPPIERVFRAFALPLEDVRAVILGQDPYATPGRAVGRAFALSGPKLQPSLRNIFKEVERCCGARPQDPTLEGWQRQGVLLLNVCLTVCHHRSGSHEGRGWERFTDRALRILDARPGPLVFLLWGAKARKKTELLRLHPALETAHPAYAHQGFSGCGHFAKANELLAAAGAAPIDWTR